MAENSQVGRPLRVHVPTGPDSLLLTGFSGAEAVSDLFRFELDMLRPLNKGAVPFDKILGQPAAVELDFPASKIKRYFHGIINRFSQGKIVRTGNNPDETFIAYRAELVPHLWLLTKKVQSRIFQHVSVPDILKTVLAGLTVKMDLQGKFHPRDYCVQYRESDFAFASRLMEEEGIYYYFKHTDKGHELVLANTPQGHADAPTAKVITFEDVVGGNRPDQRILRWEKVQEMRSGKMTLWDHNFEIPHKHLEADVATPGSVKVGKVEHKLTVGDVPKLEQYDFPGGYAGRFDGIDRGGSPQPAELQKIYEDNARTVNLRMQEEAAGAVTVDGGGNCPQLSAGHRFSLVKHFDADGDYVLTRVEHTAKIGTSYRTGEGEDFQYHNAFECIPAAVPYRPARKTHRPTVSGAQTAVVVGPAGDEIFTDKYGRVKVQFHWDRQGKMNEDSSCWIRVGTIWAGKGYGVIHIPRIGHEVIVDFLEGDPDQPIIVGSVFNADHVPPLDLPKEKVQSGLRSASSPGSSGFNGMVSNDTKSKEHLTIHAQFDETHTVEHDQTHTVKNNRTHTVNVDESYTVHGNRTHTVDKKETVTIKTGRATTITAGDTQTISAGQTITVNDGKTITVNGALQEFFTATQSTTVDGKIAIASKADIEISAATQIKLVTGASSILMKSNGEIEISGKKITISATAEASIGVGNQNAKFDTAKTAIAGAAIASSATGNHDISGALIKIN